MTHTGTVEKIPVYCYQCVAGPDLLKVVVKDGVAVGVEPNTEMAGVHPAGGTVCVRAYALIQKLYNPARIRRPMRRTNPRKGRDEDPGWEAITWEEALDMLADRLNRLFTEHDVGELSALADVGDDVIHFHVGIGRQDDVGKQTIVFQPGVLGDNGLNLGAAKGLLGLVAAVPAGNPARAVGPHHADPRPLAGRQRELELLELTLDAGLDGAEQVTGAIRHALGQERLVEVGVGLDGGGQQQASGEPNHLVGRLGRQRVADGGDDGPVDANVGDATARQGHLLQHRRHVWDHNDPEVRVR